MMMVAVHGVLRLQRRRRAAGRRSAGTALGSVCEWIRAESRRNLEPS